MKRSPRNSKRPRHLPPTLVLAVSLHLWLSWQVPVTPSLPPEAGGWGGYGSTRGRKAVTALAAPFRANQAGSRPRRWLGVSSTDGGEEPEHLASHLAPVTGWEDGSSR